MIPNKQCQSTEGNSAQLLPGLQVMPTAGWLLRTTASSRTLCLYQVQNHFYLNSGYICCSQTWSKHWSSRK